jgi:hypothetical protein
MPDISRLHDMTGLTSGELEQATRDLRTSLAPARPDSAVRVPILARMTAIDAELAERRTRSAGEVRP